MADVGEIGFFRADVTAQSSLAARRGCCVHDGVVL
jgi:hypothetical protein